MLKPAAKSLWGFGGVVQAPDGTIWTVASSSKNDTGPAQRQIDAIVLQLGVAGVAANKRFYQDHGLTMAKSFGNRYVELVTGPITLTLNKRGALAKAAGVSPDGTGSHRLVIGSDAGEVREHRFFLGLEVPARGRMGPATVQASVGRAAIPTSTYQVRLARSTNLSTMMSNAQKPVHAQPACSGFRTSQVGSR